MTRDGRPREIVIELGDDWELPDEPIRPRRPLFGRKRVLIMVFLSVLVLPLTIAGMPTSAQPALTELAVLSHPGAHGARAIIGDLVLVSSGNGNLTAFDLDGSIRWRVQLDGLPGVEAIQEAAGLILITANRGTPASVATVALDPRNGGQRWTMAGGLSLVEDVAIMSHLYERATILDPESMQPLWSVSGLAADPIADGDAILLLHRSGELSEHDAGSGARRRSEPVALAETSSYTLMMSRDFVIAIPNIGRPSRHDILWFDRATLRSVPPATRWTEWRACGPVVCARRAGDSQTMIIDPSNEAVLRRLPEPHTAAITPAGLLIMTYRALGSFSALEVVEPVSGDSRLELAGWNTVAQRELDAEHPILVWPSHRQTHVAVLRADGVHILAKVPYELFGCLYERPVLLCATSEGKLGLWHLST